MTPRYPILVFWSEDDQVWIADAPDLKSCSAFGPSPESAVTELEVAVAAWLASAKAAGHPLPVPSQPITLVAAE